MNDWKRWNYRFWERYASDNEIIIILNERAKEGWDRAALWNAIMFFGLSKDAVIKIGNNRLLRTLGIEYEPKPIIIGTPKKGGDSFIEQLWKEKGWEKDGLSTEA